MMGLTAMVEMMVERVERGSLAEWAMMMSKERTWGGR